MKVKALVAVRSGSERVVNKNLRPFAGSSLLEVKVRQLLAIPDLDGVVVNSNDERMLKLAESLGAETVKRDPRFASNQVSMSEVYHNMASCLDADVVVYANVTNPLVESSSYSKAIRTFFDLSGEFDSVNSANLVKEFMFLDNKPLNYDVANQPRSQDLPNIYALNFAFSVLTRESMIKYKNVVGLHPYMFELSEIESVDIDTEFDFEVADFFYSKGR